MFALHAASEDDTISLPNSNIFGCACRPNAGNIWAALLIFTMLFLLMVLERKLDS